MSIAKVSWRIGHFESRPCVLIEYVLKKKLAYQESTSAVLIEYDDKDEHSERAKVD